jgi:hypothetical protein
VDKGKALESASHNNATAVTAPAAAPADATALSSTGTAVASTPAHYKAVVNLLATTLPAGPEELATALMACDSTILKVCDSIYCNAYQTDWLYDIGSSKGRALIPRYGAQTWQLCKSPK